MKDRYSKIFSIISIPFRSLFLNYIRMPFLRFLRRHAKNSSLVAGIYFSLKGDFKNEFSSLLAGIEIHVGDSDQYEDAKQFALRRSIHRLEKGLIFRPMRPVFALDYIQETVDLYCSEVALNGGCRDQLLHDWAGDVLEQYFSHVGFHSIIKMAKAKYDAYIANVFRQPGESHPYRREIRDLPTSYSDLLELSKYRRSVRYYQKKSVSREIIDNAILVAGFSPSACNRQPFVFRIYDEPALVQAVSSIPMGTKGFHENFNAIAVIVGQQRAFSEPRDRHLIYIDGSLAAMSFIFALEVQGVSSCCINWPDISEREKQMKAIMNLGPDERPVMLISFGYPNPEGLIPFSQKKSVEQLRSYN
jgi:nitroreductase